jgi:acyl CoA:acetate/3-ketoacid CoA transferase beta subunit
MIVTEMAVFHVMEERLRLIKMMHGVTLDELRTKTDTTFEP